MAEPSRRASRLTIAGATLALIAVGAGGFSLGRISVKPTPAVPTATPPTPGPAPTPAPADLNVQAQLGRADLIAAVSRAADAFAAGRPLPQELKELAGRDFELRLPFGCPGSPPAGPEALNVEYDEDAEVMRVRAQPVSWAPEEWLPRSQSTSRVAEAADALEGFWIARPWTSSEACPPARPSPSIGQAAPIPAERTLGIAQIFTRGGSRLGRRDGKAYEAVERLAPEAIDTMRGLHLRLRGKLTRAEETGPVLCRAPNGMRPVCLLFATFDQVAIENPATGTTIATWDVSSQTRETVP